MTNTTQTTDLDALTRRCTAWDGFEEFLAANYQPTLYTKCSGRPRRRETTLADAYDAAQEARGSSLRIFRIEVRS